MKNANKSARSKCKDPWAGITYYEVDGWWQETNDQTTGTTRIVSVFVNDWQSEHAEEQPNDQDIFFSMDNGEIPKVGDRLSEFVVTAVRPMKSWVER